MTLEEKMYFDCTLNSTEDAKRKAKVAEEFAIGFGQWVSRNDWVYLPSKDYWVNEEQEELENKLSSKELLET